MKTWLLSILFTTSFISLFAQTHWVKIWSDEFNKNGSPDKNVWSYDVGGDGWGNQELQFYTLERQENARVENGNLVIEIRKEDYQNKEYTSARLKTLGRGDWKYGKIEVNAKIPQGKGIWSAIWLLPSDNQYGNWPKSGEIDVMENVGYDPNTIYTTIHTENYNHNKGNQIGSEKTVENPFDDFHVYGLEWYEDSLIFLLDNEPTFTIEKNSENPADWPFDQKFHLILNIAFGGSWGGSQGIDNSIFPQKMLVDYVRVYKNIPKQDSYDFTLYQAMGGTATASVENGNYASKTTVTVEAKPLEGYVFQGWEGSLQTTENPFSFELDLDVDITPKYRNSNELLTNGDFHSAFLGWREYNNIGGSNSSNNQKACFELPSKAENPWDVQLSQSGINFKEGAKYELSFFASSTSSENLILSTGINQDPWTTYFTEQFALTNELKIYSKEFVIDKKLSESDRVTFDLGNLNGTTCIDNISLKLIEPVLSAESMEKNEVPMFKIFPTKITETTTIMTVSAIKNIDIVTETGGKINSSKYTIEIISSRIAKIKWAEDLKSGVYLVKTQTEGGVHIDKLVKD